MVFLSGGNPYKALQFIQRIIITQYIYNYVNVPYLWLLQVSQKHSLICTAHKKLENHIFSPNSNIYRSKIFLGCQCGSAKCINYLMYLQRVLRWNGK